LEIWIDPTHRKFSNLRDGRELLRKSQRPEDACENRHPIDSRLIQLKAGMRDESRLEKTFVDDDQDGIQMVYYVTAVSFGPSIRRRFAVDLGVRLRKAEPISLGVIGGDHR
jgi:hypothetical protein